MMDLSRPKAEIHMAQLAIAKLPFKTQGQFQ